MDSSYLDSIGSARTAAAVSPNDSIDLANPTEGSGLTLGARALWVGEAGDVKVTTAGGNTVTLAGVAAGTILPVRVTRVWSSGTTADSIVALFD